MPSCLCRFAAQRTEHNPVWWGKTTREIFAAWAVGDGHRKYGLGQQHKPGILLGSADLRSFGRANQNCKTEQQVGRTFCRFMGDGTPSALRLLNRVRFFRK